MIGVHYWIIQLGYLINNTKGRLIMATKKPSQKPAAEKGQAPASSITARIDRLVDYGGSNVKAVASVNVAGAFAVHGLKIIDSEKGLFVSMPQSRYEKDGKIQYSDICHPITAKARKELMDTCWLHTSRSSRRRRQKDLERPGRGKCLILARRCKK